MIRYKMFQASPIESFAEGKPTTTWTAADDLPPQQIKTHLCEMGFNSDGMACVNCESQCAFGRRYISLGKEIVPERLRNGRQGVKAYKNGVCVGEFDSQTNAERALKFASHGYVSKSLKSGKPHLGYLFELVEL